jgi:hypothetical protein
VTLVSATLVAPIDTLPDEGIVAGVVYKPAFEIVPTCALPPAIWFTLQFTDWFVVPLTAAVYCDVVPIVAVAGPVIATAILVVVVPVPVGVAMLFDFAAQPDRTRTIPARDAVKIVRLKFKFMPRSPSHAAFTTHAS